MLLSILNAEELVHYTINDSHFYYIDILHMLIAWMFTLYAQHRIEEYPEEETRVLEFERA